MTSPTDDQIADEVRRVLASAEFHAPAESFWVWFWRTVGDGLLGLLRWLEVIGPLWRLVIVVVSLGLLLLAALHGWSIYRRSALSRRARTVADAGATPAPSADALAQLALAQLRSGDLRAAARTVQRAAIVHTCGRAGIPWSETTADWEWVATLGKRASAPGALARFTALTEQVAFGHAADPAAFERCWRLFQQMRAA